MCTCIAALPLVQDIVTELQSDKREMDEYRQAGVSALRDKLEEQDSKLMELSHQVGEIKSILLSLQQEPGNYHQDVTTTQENLAHASDSMCCVLRLTLIAP